MTGWRLGYAHGPTALIEEMIKLQQFTLRLPAEHGAARRGGRVGLRRVGHRRRLPPEARPARRRVARALRVRRPQGAFYLFPKAPWGTGTEFVTEAIRHNLLIIPGGTFSRQRHALPRQLRGRRRRARPGHRDPEPRRPTLNRSPACRHCPPWLVRRGGIWVDWYGAWRQNGAVAMVPRAAVPDLPPPQPARPVDHPQLGLMGRRKFRPERTILCTGLCGSGCWPSSAGLAVDVPRPRRRTAGAAEDLRRARRRQRVRRPADQAAPPRRDRRQGPVRPVHRPKYLGVAGGERASCSSASRTTRRQAQPATKANILKALTEVTAKAAEGRPRHHRPHRPGRRRLGDTHLLPRQRLDVQGPGQERRRVRRDRDGRREAQEPEARARSST